MAGPKEQVLTKWPEAHAEECPDGTWDVWAEVEPTWWETVGCGYTEAEAWEMAAQFWF